MDYDLGNVCYDRIELLITSVRTCILVVLKYVHV